MVSVVNHRTRLTREFVESLSLESQNPTGYDAALADPAWGRGWTRRSQEVVANLNHPVM